MALLVPRTGEVMALSYLLGKTASTEPLDLKLYTNNVTPGETDTAGTYTEASGNGYAAIALTGAGWTITSADPTSAAYAQQIFTFTGPLGNVYGYFLIRHTSVDLVYAEKFSNGPYNIQNNGDLIKITPTITAES